MGKKNPARRIVEGLVDVGQALDTEPVKDRTREVRPNDFIRVRLYPSPDSTYVIRCHLALGPRAAVGQYDELRVTPAHVVVDKEPCGSKSGVGWLPVRADWTPLVTSELVQRVNGVLSRIAVGDGRRRSLPPQLVSRYLCDVLVHEGVRSIIVRHTQLHRRRVDTR